MSFGNNVKKIRAMHAMHQRKLFVASCLFGLANFAWASPTVYVPLGSTNEILVIKADTDAVVDSIKEVPNVHGLAATPDGKTLVAGSLTEQKPGQGAVPPKPKGMSEDEHRRHHSAPAGAAVRGPGASFVSIIDVATRQVVRRIEVKGGVHHVAVTPDGRYALTTHPTAGGVSLIDIPARKVSRVIATGPVPNYALVTKDGKRVYVSNAGNNTVSEIDTENWIVRRNILAGKSPEHMVLSPDEKTLYVNNVSTGTLSVIALQNGTVDRTYQVGKSPHGVDLSDDGNTLFASSTMENKLVAIDLRSGKTRALPLSPAPYHVTAVRGTGKLYVSSRKQPKIWVIGQKSLQVSGEITIRGEGHEMAVVQ